MTAFDRGNDALERGDWPQAIEQYTEATQDDPTSSEAFQLLGVSLRLSRRLDEADASFAVAHGLAKTDMQEAKVLRDWSMVFVARRDYDEALDCIGRSCDALRSDRYTSSEAHDEYFASLSFRGEILRLLGRRSEAIRDLHNAYHELQGVQPYELNCAMRLLAALPWGPRRTYAPIAWRLANQARNNKRKLQIIVLMVSVRAHDWLLSK